MNLKINGLWQSSENKQANLSNQTEENGLITQVVRIDRWEKYMEKFSRLGFFTHIGQEIGFDRGWIIEVIVYLVY